MSDDTSFMDWQPATPRTDINLYLDQYMPGGWPDTPPHQTTGVFAINKREHELSNWIPAAKRLCIGLCAQTRVAFDYGASTLVRFGTIGYAATNTVTDTIFNRPTAFIVRQFRRHNRELERRPRRRNTPPRASLRNDAVGIMTTNEKMRRNSPLHSASSQASSPVQHIPFAEERSQYPAQEQTKFAHREELDNHVFNRMPRLSPPKEPKSPDFPTPAAYFRVPWSDCDNLTSPFPRLRPTVGVQPFTAPRPQSQSRSSKPSPLQPRNSPSAQLFNELEMAVVEDDDDSDASSTVSESWKTTYQNKSSEIVQIKRVQTQHTPLTPIGKTQHQTINTPTPSIIIHRALDPRLNLKDTKDSKDAALLTPPLIRNRRSPSTRLTASTISSTCNISPSVTPDIKNSLKPPDISDISSTWDQSPDTYSNVGISIDRSSYDKQQTLDTNAKDSSTAPMAKDGKTIDSPNGDMINFSQSRESQTEQVTEKKKDEITGLGVSHAQNDISNQPKTPAPTTKTTELRLAALSLEDEFTPDRPTPKASIHSSEKETRVTRAERKRLEAKKDQQNYEIKSLSQDWEEKVEHALRNGHERYRPTDLTRVVPLYHHGSTDNWLNDEVINGYLSLIVNHGKKNDRPTQVPSYHAFSSFFYTTLQSKGYDGVKRWANRAKIGGKNLLQTENIFIPINSGMHWTLCVVSGKNKTITHFNSLGSNGKRYVDLILEWVKQELGSAYIDSEWILHYVGESPQQQNSDDCGVFTITSARQIMLGFTPMSYKPSQIKTQRRRIVAELVNGGLIKSDSSDDTSGDE